MPKTRRRYKKPANKSKKFITSYQLRFETIEAIDELQQLIREEFGHRISKGNIIELAIQVTIDVKKKKLIDSYRKIALDLLNSKIN